MFLLNKIVNLKLMAASFIFSFSLVALPLLPSLGNKSGLQAEPAEANKQQIRAKGQVRAGVSHPGLNLRGVKLNKLERTGTLSRQTRAGRAGVSNPGLNLRGVKLKGRHGSIEGHNLARRNNPRVDLRGVNFEALKKKHGSIEGYNLARQTNASRVGASVGPNPFGPNPLAGVMRKHGSIEGHNLARRNNPRVDLRGVNFEALKKKHGSIEGYNLARQTNASRVGASVGPNPFGPNPLAGVMRKPGSIEGYNLARQTNASRVGASVGPNPFGPNPLAGLKLKEGNLEGLSSPWPTKAAYGADPVGPSRVICTRSIPPQCYTSYR